MNLRPWLMLLAAGSLLACGGNAENISTGLHFLPVHTLSWYRDNLAPRPLPQTELAGAQVLSLPLSAAHREADVDDVLAALTKLHAAFTR